MNTDHESENKYGSSESSWRRLLICSGIISQLGVLLAAAAAIDLAEGGSGPGLAFIVFALLGPWLPVAIGLGRRRLTSSTRHRWTFFIIIIGTYILILTVLALRPSVIG